MSMIPTVNCTVYEQCPAWVLQGRFKLYFIQALRMGPCTSVDPPCTRTMPCRRAERAQQAPTKSPGRVQQALSKRWASGQHVPCKCPPSAPQAPSKCPASGGQVLIKSTVQTTVRTAVDCFVTKQCGSQCPANGPGASALYSYTSVGES